MISLLRIRGPEHSEQTVMLVIPYVKFILTSTAILYYDSNKFTEVHFKRTKAKYFFSECSHSTHLHNTYVYITGYARAFHWDTYLLECDAKAVPDNAFTSEQAD